MGIQDEILKTLFADSRTMDDEADPLGVLIERTSAGGPAEGMSLGQFSGCGDGNDRINLSTLHSAKGREFAVVVLFGMDDGLMAEGITRQSLAGLLDLDIRSITELAQAAMSRA